MGEAKRRKLAIENGPCPCSSGKQAKLCCLHGNRWHKPPAILGLKELPRKFAVQKCYMKELGSCDGSISGEHLITHSIMLLLKGSGDFSISGLPWLEGETRILPPKTLTANCLCQRHNSALSPLDDAALYFFTALKTCLSEGDETRYYIVSGHDIERWLLKTIKALAASKNLALNGTPLQGAFISDIDILGMLDDPTHWPDGAGLYCAMVSGEHTEDSSRFQLQPYTNLSGEICGLAANIMGLTFVLMLEAPDLTANPHLATAKFRPGQISIRHPSITSWIAISWNDGRQHTDTLTLKFVRTISRQL